MALQDTDEEEQEDQEQKEQQQEQERADREQQYSSQLQTMLEVCGSRDGISRDFLLHVLLEECSGDLEVRIPASAQPHQQLPCRQQGMRGMAAQVPKLPAHTHLP
jgi:hypothetical protein